MIKLAIFGCRSIHGTLLHLMMDQFRDEGVYVAVCGGCHDYNETSHTAAVLLARYFGVAEGDQIIHHRAMLNDIMVHNDSVPEETVVISDYPLDREAGVELGCIVWTPVVVEATIQHGNIQHLLKGAS